MKKCILVLLCLTMLSAALSGCAARNANALSATDAPAATFTPMTATTAPTNTMAPTTDMMPGDGQMMDGNVNNGANGSMSGNANGNANGNAGGDMGSPASASMTPAEAGRLAERVSEAVERISEIDDAEVIVNNERALVAVEFDDQYSAGLDDRMKELITQAVQEVDDSLTDVEITDDGTLYGQIKSLAERVGNATGLDELADDFGDLWDRMIGNR